MQFAEFAICFRIALGCCDDKTRHTHEKTMHTIHTPVVINRANIYLHCFLVAIELNCFIHQKKRFCMYNVRVLRIHIPVEYSISIFRIGVETFNNYEWRSAKVLAHIKIHSLIRNWIIGTNKFVCCIWLE